MTFNDINALACAAALAVLEILKNDRLFECASQFDCRMLEALNRQVKGADYISDIRGPGLLLNVTVEGTIRLLPPFILTDDARQRPRAAGPNKRANRH